MAGHATGHEPLIPRPGFRLPVGETAAPAGDIVRAAYRAVDAAREPTIEFGLGDQIHALFEGIGGDFESPARRQDLPRASEFMT